jgi:hypothetical protein
MLAAERPCADPDPVRAIPVRTVPFLLARLSALSIVALVPLACWTGLQDCFPLPKLLALMLFGSLVAVLHRRQRREGRWRSGGIPGAFRWVLPLAAWIAIGVVAGGGAGVSAWRAWPEGALLMLPAIAAMAVSGSGISRRVADIFLVTAVMVAIYGLAQAVGWEPGRWISPFHKGVASTIGNPDLLGGFLVLPFALALARGIDSPGWLNFAVTSVLGVVLLATEARAAWLAGAVASGFLVYRGSLRTIIITVAAAVWGLAFLLFLHPAAMGNLLSRSAFTERMWTWRISGLALRSAPLAGRGAGSFRSKYLENQVLIRDRGAEFFHYTEYAHNEPVHLAVETGIVGLGLALWAVACLVAGWRSSSLRDSDPTLWRGLGAGGAGLLMNSLLSFPLHVPPTVVPLAILLGMAVGAGANDGLDRGRFPGLRLTVSACVVLALVLAFPFRLAYQSAAIYSGQAYALAGRPDAGVARYAGALKLGSGDVRLHWFAAAAALQAGDIPAALERSGEAVRMEPYLNDAWYTRGVVLKAAGRDREAEEAYRAALKINPGYALAWNNLGNLLGARGRLKEAEEAQRRALQLDPGFREARQNLAITLMMLKKSAEARRIMEGGTP